MYAFYFLGIYTHFNYIMYAFNITEFCTEFSDKLNESWLAA